MKRLITLMLVAAFTFAMGAQAQALEVNVKGDFHFAFRWNDNLTTNFFEDENETFTVRQRVRLQMEFVASENLKGVLYLNSGLGTLDWGTNGAALDTNNSTLRVSQAYIDWKVQDTSLAVKMGLQQVASPAFAAGSTFVNNTMAGVTLSNQFNDNVTASLGWYRPYNDNAIKDAVDMFMVMVPVNLDSVKITPWGEYTFIGRNANGVFMDPSEDIAGNPVPFTKKGNMWHLGIASEVKPIDDLTLAFDFTYGAAKIGRDNDRVKTDGFLAALTAKYDLSFAKLVGTAWYGSGNDKKDVRKNEFGTMPNFMASGADADPGFNVTSLGFWGNTTPMAGSAMISKSGVGTWGIMLGMEDISFVTDLTHKVKVAYYEGTSEASARDYWGTHNGISFMNEKDSAIELNFDNRYQIAKGFTMTLDTAVIFMDWQKSYERNARSADGNKLDDTMWRVVYGVQYAF